MRRLMLELRARWRANLADRERGAGRYARAERLAAEALALAVRARGPDSLLTMGVLNSLGVIHKYQGRFADGLRAYRRALSIARSRCAGDVALAALYHNFAGIEHARGRFVRAEVFARRGLAIRTRTLGPDHPDVGCDLAGLAATLDGQKRHAEAEGLHRHALQIFRLRLPADHPEVAVALANLAACDVALGRAAEAEGHALRATVMSQKLLGTSHPETAMAAANLAVIRRLRGA